MRSRRRSRARRGLFQRTKLSRSLALVSPALQLLPPLSAAALDDFAFVPWPPATCLFEDEEICLNSK